jgi:oxalate---CoA ligase
MNGETHPRTIHDLLLQQADHCRRAPAIVVRDREALTYGELSDEVERTIAALAATGIAGGARVAMTFPNGPDAMVLMLALMAGVVCIPMNPALDSATCEALLKILRAAAVIAPEGVDARAVATARSLGLQVLRLVRRSDDVAGAFDLRFETKRAPVPHEWPQLDDVAILFQTSGTTAQPKTVPLTQAQVIARSRTQPITGADRCLFVPPMYTAGAMAHTLLAPIAAGASIGFPRAHGKFALLEALEELEITYFSANPAVLASLLKQLAERPSTRPNALRFIRSAGSALTAALQLRVEEAFGVPVIQGYGTTEAGTVAGNPLPPGRREPGSVGLSVGPQIAIADENGEHLGPKLTGEIVVRSPGVMSGYENDRDANRDAFRDGWLRTGDLGHLDDDGYLFLTGRIKEIINRGGFKVSPAEVDAALLRHPDVVDAAAFGVNHPTLGEDVAAAVVIRDQGKISPRQLREFAFGLLAPYKIPSTIVFVSMLPRNATRKIDRSALGRDLRHALRKSFVAARNAEEALVASIIAEVLGIDRVGAEDNFFELGGDSLRGAQVILRVNAALGSNLAVESLFQWPIVADFAAAVPVDPCNRDGPPPLTPPSDDLRPLAVPKRSRK